MPHGTPATLRCKHCRYRLAGLAAQRCPECGEAFDPDDPETYLIERPYIIWPTLLVQTAIAFVVSFTVLTMTLNRTAAGHRDYARAAWLALIAAACTIPAHIIFGLIMRRRAHKMQHDD